MHVFAPVCGCVHMSVGVQAEDRFPIPLGTGVSRACEPRDLGAGTVNALNC